MRSEAEQLKLDEIAKLSREIIYGGENYRHKIHDVTSKAYGFDYMTIERLGLMRWLKRYDNNTQAAAKGKAWDKAMHHLDKIAGLASMRSL